MTPRKARERSNIAPPINVGGLFDRRAIGSGLLSRRATDWRANVCTPYVSPLSLSSITERRPQFTGEIYGDRALPVQLLPAC